MEKLSISQLWKNLQQKYSLSDHQIQQFQQYADLLQEWNRKFNITALTSLEDIITLHFDDSLALSKHYDMASLKSIADVGTGGGFPIIPLKIAFPHLQVVLIEVLHKRVTFLEHVASVLSLSDVIMYPYDWKMFVRKTDFQVDMVIARASLRPEELSFMFKPSSLYKDAVLVYWASDSWEVSDKVKPFMTHEVEYEVLSKKRKLVFFKRGTN